MKDKNIRITVLITEELRDTIDSYCAKYDAKMSSIVRSALTEYFEKRGMNSNDE